MCGQIVWMPTFSATNHIEAYAAKSFPKTARPMLPPVVPANPAAWSRTAPPPPLISAPAAGEGNYYGGTTFNSP